MKLLAERYRAVPLGVLSCYDRMIITGTLPGACYAGGMTGILYSRHIKNDGQEDKKSLIAPIGGKCPPGS